jgi:hypothetical protein
MKKKNPKIEKGLRAYYIELESPLDLARQVFVYPSAHIKAIKQAPLYRLLAPGEKFGDLRIIYYAAVEKVSNFFVYYPGEDSIERYDIRKSALQDEIGFKAFRAPIIEMSSSPYILAKDFKKGGKVISIEVKDSDSLIKSIANLNDEDVMLKFYAFFDNGNHIIGTFDLFREGSTKIFTYSKVDFKETFSALSYNYLNDSIEPMKSFAEKSTIYIRIINLKKPFPFFK